MSRLELACFTEASALIAAANGADRIELCSSQRDGGLTPSLSTFTSLKSQLSIPIYVMIRPHSRSFSYFEDELSQMVRDMQEFGKAAADGFVFGCMSGDEVDVVACRLLLKQGGRKPCTFHRAFDCIPEEKMEGQLQVLIDIGFKNVLTSGGAKTAVEGSSMLKRLAEKAVGQIEIVIGGGVRSSNVKGLKRISGVRWYHSSAIVEVGIDEAHGEEVRMLRDAIDEE